MEAYHLPRQDATYFSVDEKSSNEPRERILQRTLSHIVAKNKSL